MKIPQTTDNQTGLLVINMHTKCRQQLVLIDLGELTTCSYCTSFRI